jgi:hypothetical protein
MATMSGKGIPQLEQDQDGVFVPTSHTENIWAYTVDGITWAESLAKS